MLVSFPNHLELQYLHRYPHDCRQFLRDFVNDNGKWEPRFRCYRLVRYMVSYHRTPEILVEGSPEGSPGILMVILLDPARQAELKFP
jgi:hypothetical protein